MTEQVPPPRDAAGPAPTLSQWLRVVDTRDVVSIARAAASAGETFGRHLVRRKR